MKQFLIALILFSGCIPFSRERIKDTENRKSKAISLVDQFLNEKAKDELLLLSDSILDYKNKELDLGNYISFEKLKSSGLCGLMDSLNIKEILNKDDLSCMRKQIKSKSKYKLWSSLLVNDSSIFRYAQNPSIISLTKESKRLYKLTWPILSCDGNIGLIYVENYGGIEDAGGQISLFRWNSQIDHWEYLTCISIFSS